MSLLPAPPPDRVNSTCRPNLHPDDHNDLHNLVADVHQLFPEPIDLGSVFDLDAVDGGATINAEFTNVRGSIYQLPLATAQDYQRRIEPLEDWQVDTAYSTSDSTAGPFVRGTDGETYYCGITHTSIAAEQPVVGSAWQSRWTRRPPMEWHYVVVQWTFETSSATGYRYCYFPWLETADLDPAPWATSQPGQWALQGNYGWNLNQYTDTQGRLVHSTRRLEIRSRGHQAGQGPYPNRVAGLLPFLRVGPSGLIVA